MSDSLILKLKQEIISVFSNEEHPGDSQIVKSDLTYMVDSEEKKVVRDFSGKYWQDLELDLLVKHYNSIPLLTPKSYRFFLPAYMLALLEHYDELDDEPVISCLAPPFDQGRTSQLDLFYDRNSGFSDQQKVVILEFLEFIAGEYPDSCPPEYWGTNLYSMERALHYWRDCVGTKDISRGNS